MTKKYRETGSIYATKAKIILKLQTECLEQLHQFTSFEESLEVDTYEEFEVIKSYLKDNNEWSINK